MELCVMIEGQEGVTWPQWQAIAAACEQHGVGSLFRSDHYLPLDGHEERPVVDAWGTLCALAAVTTQLRLGTLVSPATFRDPAVVAKLAATAAAVSGGRGSLGLGAGRRARQHGASGLPCPASREPLGARPEHRGEPGVTPPETWISGTPDEAREQLRRLEEAGVDRVMLQLLLHDDVAQIELIGREIA